MSEESTNPTDAAPAANAAPLDIAPPADVKQDAPAADAVKTEAPVEDKANFPKKYQNEDGTPNYEKLTKAFNSLEKKLGAKPGVAPLDASEYAFDFGEGFEVNAESETAFKAKAHEAGLSKAQYEFVMAQFKEHQAAAKQADPTWTDEKAAQALKAEWGDDFDRQARTAKAAFEEFAPSDADINDPVWNHPSVMKMMARMGAELGESTISKPKNNAGAESVQAQIDALRASPDYWTPENQAKVLALYEKLG